ncbi:MAG: tRNA preQ1(34) S-adenosylmethionine ribosyltransferase-isomerase QueA [Saccharofermentanales bacterium]|jgi:S-adenosylmethionine:tRNA ribosyltransferase-isomerase
MQHPEPIIVEDADMQTSSYRYDLPEALIASQPEKIRDASRLLVMHGDGALEHRVFLDLPKYLEPGDCLVINDTRVIPARLYGHRAQTGGRVEILLLRQLESDETWQVLVKPGKNARLGEHVVISDNELEARVIDVNTDGTRIVKFEYDGDFMALIERLGEMPLPPYIHEKLKDSERYQTVYSRIPGSAAAPTAGLHFTEPLLQKISDMGINIARLTLHVGLGTFLPVKEERVADHNMHSEFFFFDDVAAQAVNMAKQSGHRVVAVGTTSCRVLESVALGQRFGDYASPLQPASGNTKLYIYPGFRFRVVDAMITNFHLPESTLLMLVSALMGREKILAAYEEAIKRQYRFYSLGDAMLLLPHLTESDRHSGKCIT